MPHTQPLQGHVLRSGETLHRLSSPALASDWQVKDRTFECFGFCRFCPTHLIHCNVPLKVFKGLRRDAEGDHLLPLTFGQRRTSTGFGNYLRHSFRLLKLRGASSLVLLIMSILDKGGRHSQLPRKLHLPPPAHHTQI